jgi:hypothetical protein
MTLTGAQIAEEEQYARECVKRHSAGGSYCGYDGGCHRVLKLLAALRELRAVAEAAEAEVARLRAFVDALARNALADDPVWVARFVLRDWTYATVPNAPKWYTDAVAINTGESREEHP